MLKPCGIHIKVLTIVTILSLASLLYFTRVTFDASRIKRSMGLRVQKPIYSSTIVSHTNIDTSLLEGDNSIRPLSELQLEQYMSSILDPTNNTLPRLECPVNNLTRYENLLPRKSTHGKRSFLFAFNLHENLEILPSLMSVTLQAIKFLGPENCAVSIMEGRSGDGTYQVLEELGSIFREIDVPFFLETSFIEPYGGDGHHRIERLAALRNLALEPMFSNRFDYTSDMRVLFLNDLQLCIEDVLELLYQHEAQEATMSCTMDWDAGGNRFRDVWIARTMVGSLFLELTHDGDWSRANKLFYDDPDTRKLYDQRQPFQVYSCWNGAAIINAEPFLDHGIRFRAQENKDECHMGEPVYLGKDLWRLGGKYGRIQVVPSINVAYDLGVAKGAKEKQGRVTDSIDTSEPPENLQTKKTLWESEPPGRVKCVRMGSFDHQSWVKST